MSAAWLWARADARRGWRSILGVAVLAGIVGGIVIATVSGARRSASAVDEMALRTGWPDVFLFTPSEVPADVRTALAKDARVSQPSVDVKVVMAAIDGAIPGYEDGTLVAVPSGTRFRPMVLEGRLPASGSTDEVAISESLAETHHLKPGDHTPLAGISTRDVSGCLADPKSCRMQPLGDVTVVGIARTLPDLVPAVRQGLSMYADPALAAAHPDIASSNIVMIYAKHRADTLAVTEELSPLVADGDVTDSRSDTNGADSATSIEHTALLIAGGLIAAAGLALLAPIYSRHLARRRHDPRLLSALGMARAQRHVAGMLPAVAAGLLAVPVALVVGLLGSFALPMGVAREAVGPGLQIDWTVTAVVAAATFAAVLVVAFVTAWAWSRTEVAQGPRSVGAIPRAVAAMGMRSVPAEGTRLALDPGSRSERLPVVPMIAATATGVALAVGALVVAASATGLLHSSTRYGAGWDLQVVMPTAPDEADALATRIAADDRVEGAAMFRTGELRVRAGDADLGEIGAIGFERVRGAIGPTVLEGDGLATAEDALLASDSFDRSRASFGDEITLEGATGKSSARLVGRTILPQAGATFSDIGVIVPLERYQQLGAEQLVNSLDVSVIEALSVRSAADRESLRADLDAQGLQVSEPPRPTKVTVLRGIAPIASILALATGLVVLSATLFSLVAATRRRRGELAVLRALGWRPTDVRRAVGWQAIVVVGASLAIGLPLGLLGGRLVWHLVADANRALPVVDLPLLRLGLVVALLLGVALLGAAIPARRAGSARPAEVLRSE